MSVLYTMLTDLSTPIRGFFESFLQILSFTFFVFIVSILIESIFYLTQNHREQLVYISISLAVIILSYYFASGEVL